MKKITILLLGLFSFFLQAQSGFGEKQLIDDTGLNPRWVVATDINGDGKQDVLVSTSGDNTIGWYENLDGQGNFSYKNIVTTNLPASWYGNHGDIDGDGDEDILATSISIDLIVWYENLDGNGSFSSAKIISNTQDLPFTVIDSDIDGDGDLDVVVCSKLDDTIAWYENLGGQGTFGTMNVITQTSISAISIATGDMDGDGDMDVVSDSSINDQPSWYRNMNGEGTFGGAHILTSENSGTISVKTADIDNDGDQDIITLEFGGNTIAWFENLNGLGTFGPKQIITTDIDATFAIEIGDIDNDGDLDLVSVSQGDNKLAWYKNDGVGNFGAQIIIDDNTEGLRSVAIADFDSDGYDDLVTVDVITYEVVWYKNLTYLNTRENPLLQLSLTPNPTTGILTIQVPNSTLKSITVYDVLGKPVLQQKENLITIDLSHLQNGMYLVKVTGRNGGTVVKKVVLSR